MTVLKLMDILIGLLTFCDLLVFFPMLVSRFTDPVPEFQLTSQVLHVVFLVRPLLLALGMLSPLDALLLWGMEQALVFGLGCSPMSSNLRFILLATSVVFLSTFRCCLIILKSLM